MDKYDYEQTDKAMSKEMDRIFSDPSKHKFYSCHEAFQADEWTRGPRGGIRKGRKLVCFHCGHKRNEHGRSSGTAN